jgi:uncharacterized protein (DUF433 family)
MALPPAETGCYEAARAAALAGLPPALVTRWARRRVVVPSAARERERLWSWADLVALRLAWTRVAAGADPGGAAEEVAAALDGFDLESAAGDDRKARGGLVAVRRLLADTDGRLLAIEPAAAPPGAVDLLGAFAPIAVPAVGASQPAPAPAPTPTPPPRPGPGRTPAQRLAEVTRPASPGKRRLDPAPRPAAARARLTGPGPDFSDLVAARRALGLPELPSTAGLGPPGAGQPDGLGPRPPQRAPEPQPTRRQPARQPAPAGPDHSSIGPSHTGTEPRVVVGPDLLCPRPALRIVPGKLGGEPHLAGTRLTTRSVAALARRGLDPGQIAGLFPDHAKGAIAEAIELERQLAAFVAEASDPDAER